MFKRVVFMLALVCLAASGVFAQPVINAALNSASSILPGYPNSGSAQGSMVELYGTGMGGSEILIQGEFPLKYEFGGVTVKIMSGGMTLDAVPIRVLGGTQMTVLVPSATPEGDAQITVTYNGQTSAPFTFKVVRAAFGIFTLSQTGSGPGIATNAVTGAVNTLLASFKAGDTVDIWGTGLGAVSFSEIEGPLIQNIAGADVKVIVGGVEVTPSYYGRTGCCAALDIVRFVIPNNVEGCYVTVIVVVNGVASNPVTIAVNRGGGTCSAGPLLASDIEGAWADGNLRLGEIDLSRITFHMGGFGKTTTDNGSASFREYSAVRMLSAEGLVGRYFSNGACTVFKFKASGDVEEEAPDGPEETDPDKYLNAGPVINVNGPNGARTIDLQSIGQYVATLGTTLPFPGAKPLYLDGGAYTFDNAGGGADVRGFQATGTFSDPPNWTNMEDIFNIPSRQSLRLTWTGAANSMMMILGTSIDNSRQLGAGFICQARGSAGGFSVPAWVIDSLPPTSTVEGFPMGALMLFGADQPKRFDAPGIDVGHITWSSGSGKMASYHNTASPPTGPPGGGGGTPPGGGGTPPGGGGGSNFAVTSSSFANGGTIPAANACTGTNLSPELTFNNVPAGAQSLLVVMDDPDANDFVHWALWDIPASTTSIPAGNPGGIGTPGQNEFMQTGYGGPCPPPGTTHNYRLRVLALPMPVNLPAGTNAATFKGFLNQIGIVALGQATITGTFGR